MLLMIIVIIKEIPIHFLLVRTQNVTVSAVRKLTLIEKDDHEEEDVDDQYELLEIF